METALVEILLNGNIGNSSTRLVTAPEIAILKHIHGEDAVINPSEPSSINRNSPQELDRLRETYGKMVVEKVFPGAMPVLPTTLSSVGLEVAVERPSRKRSD